MSQNQARRPPARRSEKAGGIGGPFAWAVDVALLWGLTALVPLVVSHALYGDLKQAFSTPALTSVALLTGAGLLLGVVWRALVQKTALGLALLATLILAPLAFLGCAAGPALASGGTPVFLAATWVSLGLFTVQSAWFVLAFALRGAKAQSRWWLLLVGAVIAAAVGAIPF